MKKIVSLFHRNYEGDRLVRDEVVPGAEWVGNGEGVATRKFDGTCCLIRDGRLFKRYDAKKGKTPPVDFEPAQPEPDPITGHWPGWRAVGNGPEDAAYREASLAGLSDGTYELCGPKIQGNPELYENHVLVKHGQEELTGVPRTFSGLRTWLETSEFEGIVWYHPDGRMVKIKRKDFGFERAMGRGNEIG